MGEPPLRGIDTKIDANDRLRRMYYEEAPPQYQRVRLAQAVAASACVPGLFDPLVLERLYPEFAAKLVDGGLYDNQGASACSAKTAPCSSSATPPGRRRSKKRPAANASASPAIQQRAHGAQPPGTIPIALDARGRRTVARSRLCPPQEGPGRAPGGLGGLPRPSTPETPNGAHHLRNPQGRPSRARVHPHRPRRLLRCRGRRSDA